MYNANFHYTLRPMGTDPRKCDSKKHEFGRNITLFSYVFFFHSNGNEPLVYSPKAKTTFFMQEDSSFPTVLKDISLAFFS